MSTEMEDEASDNPLPSRVLNIMPSIDTHGIGDSFIEKPLSPCNSLETLSDVSAVSSFASCESFKTICKAWKSRVRSASTMNLDRDVTEDEEKLEDLTSKLDMSKAVSADEAKVLAKSLSLCVVLESRTLNFTDSSEEDTLCKPGKFAQRFFEPEEIREAFAAFKYYDDNNDNFIELAELKLALEKLSVPQTHLAAKKLMEEVVGQGATQMNFCQFLLTYAAILQNNNATSAVHSQKDLVARTESVNVSKEGVSGAKRFFEAKIAEQVQEKSSNLSNEERSSTSCMIPDT